MRGKIGYCAIKRETVARGSLIFVSFFLFEDAGRVLGNEDFIIHMGDEGLWG